MSILPFKSRRGFSIVEVIAGSVIFAVVLVGFTRFLAVTQTQRQALQDTSVSTAYQSFAQEVAVKGVNPSTLQNSSMGNVLVSGKVTQTVATVGGTSDNLNPTVVSLAPSVGGSSLLSSYLPTKALVDSLTANDSKTVSVRQRFNRSKDASIVVPIVLAKFSGTGSGDYTGRSLSAGHQISVNASSVVDVLTTSNLLAPVFNLSPSYSSLSFPLTIGSSILTLPAGNPIGTIYRYTVNGVDPQATDLLWTAQTYTAYGDGVFPSQIKIRAYNPDPQYIPSSVGVGNIRCSLAVNWSRQNIGTIIGTNVQFTWGELTGDTDFNPATPSTGTNLPVLLVPSLGSSTGFELHYVLTNLTPTLSSPLVSPSSPIFLPLPTDPFWSGSASLTFMAISVDTTRYISSAPITMTLSPLSVTPTLPTIIPYNGASVLADTDVLIPGNAIKIASPYPLVQVLSMFRSDLSNQLVPLVGTTLNL